MESGHRGRRFGLTIRCASVAERRTHGDFLGREAAYLAQRQGQSGVDAGRVTAVSQAQPVVLDVVLSCRYRRQRAWRVFKARTGRAGMPSMARNGRPK
jgi:hypothetical protein